MTLCYDLPSPKCVNDVHEWAFNLSHKVGFRVDTANGLKEITRNLADLVKPCTDPESNKRHVLVDVGAAMYWTRMWFKRINADDSDALYLLASFGSSADVHAIEMNPQKVQEIVDVGFEREETKQYMRYLHIHNNGISNNVIQDNIHRCGGQNTWRLKSTANPHPKCKVGSRTNTTTLDVMAQEQSWERILYVKVDVEGGELQVLEGMKTLLREGRVDIASFEYAVGWHTLFGPESGIQPEDRHKIENASLERFQREMLELDYHTYLIHAVPSRWVSNKKRRFVYSGKIVITLVPVYGRFWSPDFEICVNRTRFYGHTGCCWNDLIVVRRGSCFKQRILRYLQGDDIVFPGCGMCV